ncbi:unnamed protein product [Ectocarpus sp. CCAP 1310/34]|nr:unnamed protein product [Ectocarpus sp. CCAP 1310/34]
MVITDVIAEQPGAPASCIVKCCDNRCRNMQTEPEHAPNAEQVAAGQSKHMPILVITYIMCRVGPIVHGLCQTAAPNKGSYTPGWRA